VTEKPLLYQFRKQGGVTPGAHCTVCPKALGASFSLTGGKNYTALNGERAADGVKVRDDP